MERHRNGDDGKGADAGRGARPPAFETAATISGPEVRPIPASRTGCLMLRSVVTGVVSSDMVGFCEI